MNLSNTSCNANTSHLDTHRSALSTGQTKASCGDVITNQDFLSEDERVDVFPVSFKSLSSYIFSLQSHFP